MIEYDAHRWRDHFLDLRGSMVRDILYRIFSCVLFAIVVTFIDRWYHPIGISERAHTMIGVALGLLLVFRTNAAYDRFWEGRKLWGSIVNASRNLARASVTLLAAHPALLRGLIRHLAAFPYAAMQRLRGVHDLGACNGTLGQGEATLRAAQHVPLALALRISAYLKEARDLGALGEYQHMVLDQNVEELVDLIGACERINNTPIPFAYVVHLRRALILYCATMPLALLPTFGWGTIPATLVLAYILFGIEEIGVEISDPFGTDDNDLPLEDICKNIQQNLMALIPADPA